MNAMEAVITQEPTPAEAPNAEEKAAETTTETVAAEETKEEVTETTTEETKEEPAKGAEQEAKAEEVADAAGIDIAAVESAFLETGEIPADTYEKAAKIGVTKEMVDEFVQYRVSQADRVREEILRPYGGEEVVGGMVDWAAKNWAPDQAKAFNDAVNSGDRGRVDLALRALSADYTKANGVKPSLLTPSTGTVVPGGVYESMEQLISDQADPRYRTDKAFREGVEKKLARSRI